MESKQEQREIYDLFRISVISKGLFSLLEVIGGIIFLAVPPTTVTALGVLLTQDELSEDPDSFIANHVLHAAQGYSHHTAVFAGLYLIVRGVVKTGLVGALLRNYVWAYPAALAVLGLFVLYQIFDIALRGSLIVTLITVYDLIVMYFIWREYQIVRRRRGIA
jgi:uncharacterized membrane protein